jgi:hypothetical protein
MSSTRSSSKRKRQEDPSNSDESSSEATPEGTVFCGWLDEGSPQPDGTIDHEAFTLTQGTEDLEVSLGDAVLMRSPSEATSEYQDDPVDYYGSSPSKSGSKMMVARVERIWEETKSGRSPRGQDTTYNFKARWFLKVSQHSFRVFQGPEDPLRFAHITISDGWDALIFSETRC